MRLGTCFAALCLIVFTQNARASRVFTDRLAWEAALGANPIYTETFDDAVFPAVIIDGTVIDFANGLTMFGQGAGGLAFLSSGNNPPAFPTRHIETDFETTSTMLVFGFDNPVIGFGLDYAQAEFADSVWIDSPVLDAFSAPANPSSLVSAFVGVVLDTPASEFSLATAANDQDYDFDDLRFVFVPEPSGTALLLAALLVVVNRRDRRCDCRRCPDEQFPPTP